MANIKILYLLLTDKTPLFLLTYLALSGFSLYKYTTETHINQLLLGSNIMYKRTDQNTHTLDSIKLLTILAFPQ